jgi:alkanesulfonate monooxygenase SsuD/methylene tetrahydromethanopterin reductase-like flavin-dependent oxidoreductase (luciferase family)
MALALFIDVGRSLDDAVRRVQLAEKLGYDEVWRSSAR